MRTKSIAAWGSIVLMNTSCGGNGGWPAVQDIDNALEATLRAVAGNREENGTAAALPVTVSGGLQRPLLALAFEGMLSASRQVKGVAQKTYTTVGGIGSTLTLTAPGFSRDIAILLHEK